MRHDEKLSELIGQIYDAAADASLWPRFLTSFSDAAGGDGTHILVHDMTMLRGNAAFSVRSDPHAAQLYARHFGAIDPWRAGWLQHFSQAGPDGVVTGEQVIPTAGLQKTEFYNDFLVPNGIRHQFCGPIHVGKDWSAILSCLRSGKRGPFTADAINLLRLLLPHLQRAVQLQRQIATLSAGEEVLHQLSAGIVFVSERGEILFANQAAEEMFRAGDGLKSSAQRIRAWNMAGDEQLQAAIRNAAAPGSIESGRNGILLNRRSLLRPYQVTVFPFRSGSQQLLRANTPAVLVLIVDPEKEAVTDEALIASLLGLTRTESHLAALLLNGRSTGEIAGEMKIQENTVRAHLKAIFARTGTRSQAELVRLLMKSFSR